MADPAIVKEWVEKADEDFRFAEANLMEGSEFYAQICFHFQQAAEKYLKAFIIDRGLALEKVHDLVHLLKTCSSFEPAFGELKEDGILLNTAYIETRYPLADKLHGKISSSRSLRRSEHRSGGSQSPQRGKAKNKRCLRKTGFCLFPQVRP